MTAEEIRSYEGVSDTMPMQVFWLKEIAAQLADLNTSLTRSSKFQCAQLTELIRVTRGFK